jgi:hypothetical protein
MIDKPPSRATRFDRDQGRVIVAIASHTLSRISLLRSRQYSQVYLRSALREITQFDTSVHLSTNQLDDHSPKRVVVTFDRIVLHL